MSQTQGRWTAKTPFPDLQFFVGFNDLVDTSAHAVLASQGIGLIDHTLGASLAATFFSNVKPYLRTGVYATSQYDQEQFGTAASQPGPSTVSRTNGPDAEPFPNSPYYQGFPPTVGSSMATLAGAAAGPQPKGIQIDSIDVIYAVTGAALAAITIGLVKTVFTNAAVPATSNIIPLAANGLSTVISANPYVTNVPVAAPAMITDADAEVILNLNVTTAAGGAAIIYGVVFHCHYNYA